MTINLSSIMKRDTNFIIGVSMRMYPGIDIVDKFGENPDVDSGTIPEDIWEGGGSYVYDAGGTNPIKYLSSNNVNDITPIEVSGLDINGELVVTDNYNKWSK